QRAFQRAVLERDAADVEQVTGRLDVAVRVDLRAVGGDDGDGRGAGPAGVRGGRRLAQARHEPLGALGRDARAQRLPVRMARLEGRARPRQARGRQPLLVRLVGTEVGELRVEAAEVEHRRSGTKTTETERGHRGARAPYRHSQYSYRAQEPTSRQLLRDTPHSTWPVSTSISPSARSAARTATSTSSPRGSR